MSCHFSPPGKRKQKNLFTFAPAFQNCFLKDGLDYENCRVRQDNPSKKHRENYQCPKDCAKLAFPDGGKSSLNCSLQPLLRNGPDCRRNPAPNACYRKDRHPERCRDSASDTRPREPYNKEGTLDQSYHVTTSSQVPSGKTAMTAGSRWK